MEIVDNREDLMLEGVVRYISDVLSFLAESRTYIVSTCSRNSGGQTINDKRIRIPLLPYPLFSLTIPGRAIVFHYSGIPGLVHNNREFDRFP